MERIRQGKFVVGNEVLPSLQQQSFWGVLDPQTQNRLLNTEQQVREKFKALAGEKIAKSVLVPTSGEGRDAAMAALQEIKRREQTLIKAYQNWLNEIGKRAENPIIESSPAEKLTLGGGGLFRNFQRQIRIGQIPDFRMPNISPSSRPTPPVQKEPETLQLITTWRQGFNNPDTIRFIDPKTGKEYTRYDLIHGNLKATITPFYFEPMLAKGVWETEHDFRRQLRSIKKEQGAWQQFAVRFLQNPNITVNPIWMPKTLEEAKKAYSLPNEVNWRAVFNV